MCNLYTLTTNAEGIRRAFAVTSPDTPNLPPLLEIYPNQAAPVIRDRTDGVREFATMVWGFPPPDGSARPVTNVRNLSSPFWKGWLSKPAHRCLVPVDSFAEWSAEPDPVTKRKRKVWFTLSDEADRPFAFAGIWRPSFVEGEAPRMAFLTTMANRLVASVHPKAMPVILARANYDQWLSGSYAEATALARAYPAEAMTLIP